MKKCLFPLLTGLLVAGALQPAWAAGISDDVIRIGFLADLSGSRASVNGDGGADAIRMAIADMGGEINGKKIELLTGDHQNDPEAAASRAQDWFDHQQLDVLVGGARDEALKAMAKVAAGKQRLFIAIGAGTNALVNEDCSPLTLQYGPAGQTLAASVTTALVKRGASTWFLLGTDDDPGLALQQAAQAALDKAHGKLLDDEKLPAQTTELQPFLSLVRQSGASTLGLAATHGPLENLIKARHAATQPVAPHTALLQASIDDIHRLASDEAAGLYLTTPWYWNRSKASREWASRFMSQHDGRAPSALHAADYSAVRHYLEAVKATGTDEAARVTEHLKSHDISDFYAEHGRIQWNGLLTQDLFLARIRAADPQRDPWDHYEIVRRIQAREAYASLSDSSCPLPRP